MTSTMSKDWLQARLELREVLASPGEVNAQTIRDHQQTLNTIYTEAFHSLQDMRAAESLCKSLCGRLMALSIADTLCAGIGMLSLLAINTEVGEEHPWLKTAGLCFLVVAQGFSKANDFLGNKEKKEMTQLAELQAIIDEGKSLLALLTSLGGNTARSVDRGSEVKALCLQLLPTKETAVIIEEDSEKEALLQ